MVTISEHVFFFQVNLLCMNFFFDIGRLQDFFFSNVISVSREVHELTTKMAGVKKFSTF